MSLEPISEDALRAAMHGLIDVRPGVLGLEVELPLVYPNGETAAVTVAWENDGYVVHDGGNGVAVLGAHGLSVTANMAKRLVEIAKHYGCEFVSGRMSRRAEHAGLAIAVAIVANASRSIGDQLLIPRNVPIVDFKTEALEVLKASVGTNRIRENERVSGASGSTYVASAVVLSADGAMALSLVEPVRDNEAATRKFREFWDISQNETMNRIQRIAIYDDRREWSAPDLNLLQRVCNIVRLSDSFRRMQELIAR